MEDKDAIEICKRMVVEDEVALNHLISLVERYGEMMAEVAYIEFQDGRKILQIDEGAQAGRWKEFLSPIPSVPSALDAFAALKENTK